MNRITWLLAMTAVALLLASALAFAQGGEGQAPVTAAAVPGGLGGSPRGFGQSPATGPPPYSVSSVPPRTPIGVTQCPVVVAGQTSVPAAAQGPVSPTPSVALPPGLPVKPTALAITSDAIYVIANNYLMKFDKNLCMLSQIPLPPPTTVAVAGFRSQPAAAQNWVAHLAPLEAQGYSQASGLARVSINPEGQTLHYTVDVQNLQNVTGIYLQYAMGQLPAIQAPAVASLYRGPVLTQRCSGTLAQGDIGSSDLTGWFASYPVANLVTAINSGRVYVVVHTTQHPQGEIMGLLRPESAE